MKKHLKTRIYRPYLYDQKRNDLLSEKVRGTIVIGKPIHKEIPIFVAHFNKTSDKEHNGAMPTLHNKNKDNIHACKTF